MIEYTLPPLKKPKKGEDNYPTAMPEYPYEREVDICASQEIIDALGVGEEATITLKGEVCVLEMRKREDKTEKGYVRLRIASVMVDEMNEIQKLMEDEE